MQEALNYLQRYAELLRGTSSVEQLYGGVLDWQFAQHHSSGPGSGKAGVHVQKMISKQYLGMKRDDGGVHERAWLRHHHFPTTAVGGFKGLVVVAAMPSWSEKHSPAEMEVRGKSAAANRAFCERFFVDQAAHVAKLTWWKRVARFAYRVLEGDALPKDIQVLKWAATGMVGAVDLVPFHAQDDKLTGQVRDGQRLKAKEPLLGALHSVAEETLQMALRLRPKALLVASRSGAYLASELASSVDAKRTEDLVVEFDSTVTIGTEHWPWSQKVHLHRFVVTHKGGGTTTMYTLPGQVFSTQANLTKMHTPLAVEIRKDLAR